MFKKIILTSNPVTEAAATVLVEVGGVMNDIAITTLDGLYETVEEFEVALEATIARGATVDTIYNFFPMTLPDVYALIQALRDAATATEEAAE